MAKNAKRRLTDDPKYSAALEKLNALRAEHNATEQRLRQLREEAGDTRREDGIRAEAAALLEGERAEQLKAVAARRAELPELERKSRVLHEAAQMQSELTRQVAKEASHAECQRVLPEWCERANAVLAAVEALAEAIDAEKEFRTEISRRGFSIDGPLLRYQALYVGRPDLWAPSEQFNSRSAGKYIELVRERVPELYESVEHA